MTERGHFNVGPADTFRETWREYKARKQPPAERWRIGSETLLHSWHVFMKKVLSPVTWLALQLYLERWNDLRLTWTKPGGYFFTRANNRRKRIREELRPRHTVTLLDSVERARKLYQDAMEEEGYYQMYWQDNPPGYQARNEDCDQWQNGLLVATLILSGAIYGGGAFDGRTVRIKHKPAKLVIPEVNHWPWPRSVNKRLRALRRSGLLTQPDWREVRL